MAAALAFLHKCFVSGALAKGWGGPVCRAALDFQTHVVESLFWLTICAVSFTAYGVRAKFRALLKAIQTDLAKSTPSASARTFEVCLAMVHFSMFLQIVYYKVNILSLINMIQPCHLILLLQGIALYSRGSLGVLISLFILPALTGTLLAMVFPDTGGLDQYLELDSYWVHHYLIQAVPLYLLVRNNFLACRHASLFSLFCGLWILVLLHFSLYEIVDLSLDVNVEVRSLTSLDQLLP